VVEGAVLELQSTSRDTDLRSILHQVEQSLERSRTQLGVRVEDEHVRSASTTDRFVRRGGEAAVGF
jgi:hypothetical protein